MSVHRVKKRDGREVPFDKARIAHAVARAQHAVGEEDAQFASEVADVVELTLARQAQVAGLGAGAAPYVPSIEQIQDLVEQALIELGRAPLAKAYILYRDRRARIRAALEVRPAGHARARAADSSAPGAARTPRVEGAQGALPWNKDRIVAALIHEADLPRATAEDVAARVEERVFASGFTRVSSALVREFVDQELSERGLTQSLGRQGPIGLPRHALRALLADPARPAEEALSAALLRRFALEDVLAPASARLLRDGELFVENLERPHLALVRCVPCELVLSGEPGVRAAFAALGALGSLARASAHGLVLEDCAASVSLLARASAGGARATLPAARRMPTSPLASWLAALGALGEALHRHVDLCLSGTGAMREGAGFGGTRAGASAPFPASIFARLLDELTELQSENPSPWLPRVFVDGTELARWLEESSELAAGPERPPGSVVDRRLASSVDRLLAAGRLIPTWSGAGERFAGPGLVRRARERGALALGAAVALNLPRAARRAGPWREDALLEELARMVEQALDVLESVREFQRAQRHEERSTALRSRTSYAIVPVGLREMLRTLGDGELAPEQGARVLSFLTEAVERFAQQRRLPAIVTPFFGERAAARFALLDAELFPTSQPLLYALDERAVHGRGRPYAQGFDLSRPGPAAQPASSSVLEASAAALFATQRCGAVHPPALLDALAPPVGYEGAHDDGAGEREPRALAAWQRLERARERAQSGAYALYVLPGTRRTQEARALPYPDHDPVTSH